MNAQYPHLFALALTLPLASCHFVGQRPDFSVMGDALSPATYDNVDIESAPTPSIPLPAGYQPPAPPADSAPTLAHTEPQPAAPPARAEAEAAFRTPSLPSFSQQQPQPAPRQQPAPGKAQAQADAPLFSQAATPPTAGSSSTPGGTYTVRPGDTLTRIARAHKVSLANLAAANGLTGQSDHIRVGQQLRIPQGSAALVPPPLPTTAPSTPVAQPTPTAAQPTATAPATSARQYRVRPGDTLYRIARQHGISYHELMRANNLDETSARSLRDGTLLTIPTQP